MHTLGAFYICHVLHKKETLGGGLDLDHRGAPSHTTYLPFVSISCETELSCALLDACSIQVTHTVDIDWCIVLFAM